MKTCCDGAELASCGTLQDKSENFWYNLAPELPANLLTRVAFAFKAHRQVNASQRNIDLARTVNAACHWNGRCEGSLRDLTEWALYDFLRPDIPRSKNHVMMFSTVARSAGAFRKF
jgi:hypothetical protein